MVFSQSTWLWSGYVTLWRGGEDKTGRERRPVLPTPQTGRHWGGCSPYDSKVTRPGTVGSRTVWGYPHLLHSVLRGLTWACDIRFVVFHPAAASPSKDEDGPESLCTLHTHHTFIASLVEMDTSWQCHSTRSEQPFSSWNSEEWHWLTRASSKRALSCVSTINCWRRNVSRARKATIYETLKIGSSCGFCS